MSESDYKRWICDACGYIYDEAKGDPDSGLNPGTRYDEIPDDWMCPLCGLSKSDLRLIPDQPQLADKAVNRPVKSSAGKSKGGSDYVVIVGAGIAAWSVAEEIRQIDADRPILMVTACDGASYPKPAISTALAHGKSPDELIEKDAVSKAAELGIEIRTETRVLKVDSKKKKLTTVKGGIQYDQLILALGASQRSLTVNGDAVESIIRVNDLAAYRKLRKRLDENVKHITILGAGLIGCEFAEDLSSVGYKVSIIDPTNYPLSNLLPEESGKQLESKLSMHGVKWLWNTTLDALDENGENLRATLSDGKAIETDLVLSAAGLVANTQLASKARLAVNKGIIVDRQMRSSNKDIFSLGDCAEVEGQIFAYIEPIRRQAKTIAMCLKGEDCPFEIKPPLIRVKTPSYPLSICQPGVSADSEYSFKATGESDHIDLVKGEELVGFVLAGEQSKNAYKLYSQIT